MPSSLWSADPWGKALRFFRETYRRQQQGKHLANWLKVTKLRCMSPLDKLGVRIPKTNNLFNFGLNKCTRMKRPAELVQPATVYPCPCNLQQNSECYFNPQNLLLKKNCRAPKQHLFQQQYISGVPSLKPASRTRTAEWFLSPSPGSTFACGVYLTFV